MTSLQARKGKAIHKHLKKGTLRGSFFGDTSHAEKIFFHFISKKLIFNGKNDVV